jgi:F-type H+-transporting ATPase subunit epsilon
MPRLWPTTNDRRQTTKMADTFQLEIVTPERLVVRDVAEEVQIPGKNGYLGILPGHAPLITELAVGEITYKLGNTTHHLACAWGFAEVLPAKVTILAETAERAEEINTERARQARERAEQELKKVDTPEASEHVLDDLRRAEVRLEVAAKAGKKTEAH